MGRRAGRGRASNSPRRVLFTILKYFAVVQVSVLLTIFTLSKSEHASKALQSFRPLNSCPKVENEKEVYVKPEGLRVVDGRPEMVDILDCYLKQNLVSRGGWLDEVIFYRNTEDSRSHEWLEKIAANEPEYTIAIPEMVEGLGYLGAWSVVTEDETVYVKMDDDLVWLDEQAIPSMVATLLDNPDSYIVLANLINSPITHWFHWHNEAVYPFLPETLPPPPRNLTAWRTSELPVSNARYGSRFNADPWLDEEGFKDAKMGDPGAPPHRHHRWLPLKEDTSKALYSTPMAWSQYFKQSHELYWWGLPAQQHYSLFRNLEQGSLWRYEYGNRKGIWNSQWETRLNLNMAAIWGRTVKMRSPSNIDEEELTIKFPLEARRRKSASLLSNKATLIQTRALASHFSFGPVAEEMRTTDLMDRYRAYANEMVCERKNKKRPMPHFDSYQAGWSKYQDID